MGVSEIGVLRCVVMEERESFVNGTPLGLRGRYQSSRVKIRESMEEIGDRRYNSAVFRNIRFNEIADEV